MAVSLPCPKCQNPLSIPDSLLGQLVKCPECGSRLRSTPEQTLVVEEPPAEEMVAASTPAPPTPSPTPPTKVCPFCSETIPNDAAYCPFCNEDLRDLDRDEGEPPLGYIRRDVLPHRANIVLLLGVLSSVTVIAACCFQLVGVIGVALGLVAVVMANHDLPKMHRGEMDPAGRENTNLGRIFGIIGMVLNGLMLLLCLGYLGLMIVTELRNQPGGPF
jgi:endogenous inhibitor of DNA gyrase (YacG/DUF329 family)